MNTKEPTGMRTDGQAGHRDGNMALSGGERVLEIGCAAGWPNGWRASAGAMSPV